MRRKIAAIFLGIVLSFSIITYFLVKEVMIAKPSICKYCHFITPFYNKWSRSSHNMVPCLKCHEYGPLNALSGQLRFILGTYNPRPLTRVPDSKCLQPGCHEKRLIESEENLTRWNIVFDHKPHFTEHRRGINLHCRSCHSDIVQGEHMKVSMNVCFICHLTAGGSGRVNAICTDCHGRLKRNVWYHGRLIGHLDAVEEGASCDVCHIEVTIGGGMVPMEKCFFCHINRTEQYGDADFVHRQHVTKKQIDCFFCHQFVEHGNIKLSKDIDSFIRKK